VDRLRARGCPIGGVGTQTHLGPDAKPGLVTRAIEDLATLGLPIHVSEFDVRFGPAGQSRLSRARKLEFEAALADETMAAFLALPQRQQYAFTTWGVRDRDSNLNRPAFGGDGSDTPLLFDDAGAPKPAFWAVADRLAARYGRKST
jgi:endo-1,4-beta-xylanase